jgi:hypothetical protein
MLLFKAKLLKATLLEAKGDYPPSALVSLYDPDAGEAVNLIADRSTLDTLSQVAEFADVVVKLRWRAVNLASLGGSGRGKAYRLQIVGVASGKDAA